MKVTSARYDPGVTNAPIAEKKPELTGLTGIRALAAGWVVVEHFRLLIYALFPDVEALSPWITSGYLGVEVFFVLSGFIIAYNYADRFATFAWSTYRRFLLARVARIYPVHLVTLAAVLVLVLAASVVGTSLSDDAVYTPWGFLANVFVLQGAPGVSAWNDPAWTISLEFAAYICFPLIALLLPLLSRFSAFAAAAAVVVIGTLAMITIVSTSDASPTSPSVSWLRIATEFTTGCLMYAGWCTLRRLQFGSGWDVVAIASLAGTAVVIGVLPDDGASALVTVPLIAVFVLACAGATGPLGKLLATRFMLWGGRVSYSVYMTHFILLMVLGEVLSPTRFQDHAWFVRAGVLVFYFGTVVLAGWLCYRLVEVPGRRAVNRLAAKTGRRATETDPSAVRSRQDISARSPRAR